MFSGDEPFPPGSEPGELGELRGRLLFLLETSKHYQAQHLLTHFPEGKLTISLIIVTSLITESESGRALLYNSLCPDQCC